jgi:hypothetical protein
MKILKVWVAQDYDGECYLFRRKPKNYGGQYPNWKSEKENPKLLGENILCNSELKIQPIECRIITENHYRVLEMD